MKQVGEGGHGSNTFSFIAHSSEFNLRSETPNMPIYWVIFALTNHH